MPKVSVIMSVYNEERRIKTAIESILKQTFNDFELIICDDGSSDNTYKVIEKIADRDRRIMLLRNLKNLGLAQSLNKCLSVATGEYIARMDADDISHPERLKKQVGFMENNPQYAVVGTSKRYFDDDGVWGKTVYEGERTLKDIYCGRSFTHPTVLIRREVLEDVGFYTVSPLTRRGQDYDLWCKLYYNGYVGYNVPEVLFDYYESKQSIKRRKFKYRVDGFKLRLYWRKKFDLPVWYDLYAYKELVAGLIPKRILLYRRKKIVDKV